MCMFFYPPTRDCILKQLIIPVYKGGSNANGRTSVFSFERNFIFLDMTRKIKLCSKENNVFFSKCHFSDIDIVKL